MLLPFVILNDLSYRGYAYVMIVHAWADQRLPQLLVGQFDTLPSQCRHIEYLVKKDSYENLSSFTLFGLYIYICIDSTFMGRSNI